MALPNSLILASEVTGFISFAFTLLTLIGVYADLIKTLRGAPTTIPIALGNLREEIRYEQLLVKHKLGEGDDFHVFPGTKPGKRGRHEFTQLLDSTLRLLWTQFCDIERGFLVKGEKPWNDPESDDDGDRMETDEKSARRRRGRRPRPDIRQSFIKGRMGWVEAGLSRDRSTYYNTDISHRFLWWWKRQDVNELATQLQRLQIRRIERDSYESTQLVKRSLKYYGRRSGIDVYHSSDDSSGDKHGGGSGSDGGGGGGGGGGGRGRRSGHHRHRRHSGTANGNRRRSKSNAPVGFREVSEKEIVQRKFPSPTRTAPSHPRAPPSVVSRSERPRRGSVVYEYEVVDPGRIHVEYGSPRQDHQWHEGRQRSYSRERTRDDD